MAKMVELLDGQVGEGGEGGRETVEPLEGQVRRGEGGGRGVTGCERGQGGWSVLQNIVYRICDL